MSEVAEVDRLSLLGRAVRERRRRMGITQEQVSSNGGPSGRTVRAIEANAVQMPGESTLRALDDGLHWDRNTAADVLAGSMTVEQAVQARQVARVSNHDRSTGVMAVGTSTSADLERSMRGWARAIQAHSEPEDRNDCGTGPSVPKEYRASAPLARALAALQAIPDPTPTETAAVDAVWRSLAMIMNERAD